MSKMVALTLKANDPANALKQPDGTSIIPPYDYPVSARYPEDCGWAYPVDHADLSKGTVVLVKDLQPGLKESDAVYVKRVVTQTHSAVIAACVS